jgi:hypothetical protein
VEWFRGLWIRAKHRHGRNHQTQSSLRGELDLVALQPDGSRLKTGINAVLVHHLSGAFLWTYWFTLFPSRKMMREDE